jgi:WD40-like Beta Propeller Repeat
VASRFSFLPSTDRRRALGANGALIVFARDIPPCPMGYCKRVIATVHPDGSGERHLTKGAIDGSPALSPDSKRVAFVRQYPVKPGPQLWVMKAGGTGLQDLANGLIGIGRTDPRPTGSTITGSRSPRRGPGSARPAPGRAQRDLPRLGVPRHLPAAVARSHILDVLKECRSEIGHRNTVKRVPSCVPE